MKIEPTELFHQEVFGVLKKIKHKYDLSGSEEISYQIRLHPVSKNKLYHLNEQTILQNLAQKKLLKITEEFGVTVGEEENPKAAFSCYNIKIIEPNFGEFYEEYKSVFQNKSKDTLILNTKTGNYSFTTDGKTYKAYLHPESNSFKALLVLAKHSGEKLSYKDINVVLNNNIHSGDNEKERINEALKYAKRKLNYKGKRLIQPLYDGLRLLPTVEIERVK